MNRRSFLKHTGVVTVFSTAGWMMNCQVVADDQQADISALYRGADSLSVPAYSDNRANGWALEYWGCENAAKVTLGSPILLTSPVIKITEVNLIFSWPGEHRDTTASLEIDGKPVCLGLVDEKWRTWDVSRYSGKTAVFCIYDTKRNKPQTYGNVMVFQTSEAIKTVPKIPQFQEIEKKQALLPAEWSYDPKTNQWRDQTLKSDYSEKYRPQFHFSRNHGWMNDPNGLVYYKGVWHLCFQAHNYWGHAVSRDLVHWKQIDDAFGTDNLGHAWSGSTVVDWNNTAGFQTGAEPALVAIYTSCGFPKLNPKENLTYYQFQCLAYSNDEGKTWTKYEGNPVLRHMHRDPKVFWHAPTKRWIMVLMLRLNGTGFFTSTDLKNWRKESVCTEWEGECPDFFELPLQGAPGVKKWVGVNGPGHYWIGEFDGKTFTVESPEMREDYGRHHYSTQTFNNAPDGRVVQVTWSNAHNKWGGLARNPEGVPDSGQYPGNPFNQQMNVPRELTLHRTPEGLRMFCNPVEEIKTIYDKMHTWTDLTIKPGENPFKDLKHDLYDVTAVIEPGQAKEVGFVIAGEKVAFTKVDKKLTCTGHSNVIPYDGKFKMRLLIDRISIEIFIDDGHTVMTYCFLPKDGAAPLELYAKGGDATVHDLKVVELKSIFQK